MNKLAHNFSNLLPLNRKERFYTGTVLPQIICHENFKHFNRFLKLIPNFPTDITIIPNASNNNILFLTEYSLKESLVEESLLNKYSGEYETKDTPDVVILITKPEYYLIVIEAKMYSGVTPGELNIQMNNQLWMIDAVKKALSIKSENCYHIGMVPEKLIPRKESTNYPLIYWEDIIKSYSDLLADNYFLNVLQIAIDKFDQLQSSSKNGALSYGKNMDTRLSGEKILELHEAGERFWVGRSRGLLGDKIKTDIGTGGWKTFEYEVNFSSKYAPNSNWFSTAQFAKFVLNNTNKSEDKFNQENSSPINADEELIDQWHFSHLGRDYFLDIASKVGFGRTLDAPIYLVYVGKTGVAYAEKRKGRNVNPNWSIITKDGREFKCGNTTGYIVEKGLWDRKKCTVLNWDELKEYFENQLRPKH